MSTTLSFDTFNDSLPPFNAEAEESILGGILLDENAIHRIKETLKPEHFYLDSHKTIYRACLKLADKDKKIQIPVVESYLRDNDLLSGIGGRNKIAALLDRTVSTVNIDGLSELVIDKAIRRGVIKIGSEIAKLGYSVNNEISEIMAALEKQTRSIIETSRYQTKEQAQRARHDQMLKDLTEINTTCGEPSYRFYKIKDLADKYEVSMKFLETLYLKSLASQCSKLLTYEELKEIAGGTIREWLLNGLVPKKSTICLVADGGVGKTKYAYSLAKLLIEGKPLGIFQPTGEKRKILFCQGDETELDMYQALETLGYSEGDVGKYVKICIGWTFENMPILIQELQDENFKPDFVVIDSLSSANRLSIFREGEMEYARPLLELAALATKYNCTFLVIHHTNKAGDTRGSTAIRNSVSEFWKLTQPTDSQSTKGDRILEIDKSRSRSCKKKYRLFFNSEDLSFSFLGEEIDQHSNNSESALKQKILGFFNTNRNKKYTALEVARELGTNYGHTRNSLSELKSDGLLSLILTPGKANQYFLSFEGGTAPTEKPVINVSPESLHNRGVQRNQQGVQHNQPPGAPGGCSAETTIYQDSASLHHLHPQNAIFSSPSTDFENKTSGGAVFSKSPELIKNNGSSAAPGAAPLDAGGAAPDERVNTQPRATNNTVENLCPRTGLPLPQPFEVKVESVLGTSICLVTPQKLRKKDGRMECRFEFEFANGATTKKSWALSKKEQATEIATKEINDRMKDAIKHSSRRYSVYQIVGEMLNPEEIWVEGCQCVEVPEHPVNSWWVFRTPAGDRIQVAGDNEFKLET
ncbi:AAA family ATPase [Plectonema radiosum NIES-515]|uniref:AAA family ATPase n=1 Tax=Plectonema radiosum NIES-515 TaxID=2986073 RepID=A0ABT3B569_9CYAN|nr:DnaB-like helicase N-terminal domain-containing protein [Plectonema radiosum]MCV3216024.1 AAA family ATPase [Plectonema radiosum NIES-515]